MNINWNILYYPDMSVPPRETFSQFVLFFESCGIIVPWEDFDEEQDDATRELIRSGFIRPVAPIHHLGWPPEDDKKFMKALFQQRPRRDYDRIHLGKLSGMGFFREMEERGLAVREANSLWYHVFRPHSQMLMTYIALQLGRQETVGRVPTTASHDAAQCVANLDPSVLDGDAQDVGAFFRELFVYPTDADYRDIMNFKEKHSRLLVDFRRQMDYVGGLDAGAAKEELARMIEFKHEFADKMRSAKWSQFSRSDFAAVSLVALAALYDKSYASAAVAFLAPAIKGMFDRSEERENLLRNPVAYAALAHQRFRPPRPPVLSRWKSLR